MASCERSLCPQELEVIVFVCVCIVYVSELQAPVPVPAIILCLPILDNLRCKGSSLSAILKGEQLFLASCLLP